jgi:hypothetical protein
MTNSIVESVTGEDRVSLIAQRIFATKELSAALSMHLVRYTDGKIRTSLYNSKSMEILRSMNSQSTATTFDYKFMNPEEIRNPDLTPNLAHIKALTDDILTQMNLDASGMSACYSLSSGFDQYKYTDFFMHFLYPARALVPPEKVLTNLDSMIAMINEAEDSYKCEWEHLFVADDARNAQ